MVVLPVQYPFRVGYNDYADVTSTTGIVAMPRFRDVDPGDLHLPPGRQDGAVPSRYHDQVAKYQGRMDGMPPVEVTEGRDGELMINNGVTRATRIHYLAPGQLITVEITDTRPKASFAKLLRVRDVAPPP